MKTIFSLVTKPINQNVGIIRISGPDAFDSIKEMIPRFTPGENKVQFQKLIKDKGLLDDALVLSFVAPNSFTGENVIEIQSHGSMFIVNEIISELKSFGLEQSEPGEFMKQAYMNGKLDLSQTEAINTMILSENADLTARSIKNLNGEQSDFINQSIEKLGSIISNIQVSIDYPENTDLPEYNLENIKKEIEAFEETVEKIISDSSRLVKYAKGIIISLVGIPNAGKSTLLNALSNEERAIVSDIEGTTRDVVESTMYIDGVKVTLQDTAGIRSNTDDVIEREGINRSIKSINESDIVILLLDGTKDLDEQRKIFKDALFNNEYKIIEVITKSDLVKNEGINISALNKKTDALLDQINKFIKENIFDIEKNNDSLLITQNQIDNFNEIKSSLDVAIKFIKAGETPDVIAFELENSMKKLGKIIGKEIDQDYLNNLFSSFCVGK